MSFQGDLLKMLGYVLKLQEVVEKKPFFFVFLIKPNLYPH